MEQTPSTEPLLFGGRYKLIAEHGNGRVEVQDHQPWRRCWSCGATDNVAGEGFCTNCGASLDKRTYRGTLLPAGETGSLALVATISDEAATQVLPTVWDVVEEGGQQLVLLRPEQHAPVEPPLDELMAMRVGIGLARMLVALHQNRMVVGTLAPEYLSVAVDGHPRLLDVPRLRRTSEQEHASAVRNDLQELAGLLEALSSTPRTTQRLRDSQRTAIEGEGASATPPELLSTVLSQLRTGTIPDAQSLADRMEALVRERTQPIPLRHIVGSSSDTGVVRDHNEDSLFTLGLNLNNTSAYHTHGLYIVADGMGGHAAGEVASGLAVRSAAEALLGSALTLLLDPTAEYDEQWFENVTDHAVRQSHEAVRRDGTMRGNDMGTTLTLALVVGDRVIVANVGDSRTYLYRDGALRRISQDHSLVMRLVELGQLAEEDIYSHPQRNAVLRSLGDQSDIDVDLFSERLQPGDALLLCSDGQWEMTRDATMEQLIATHADPQRACEALVAAANEAGGEDNISVVLVRFEAFAQ
jgi:protein phosphatase